MRTSRHGVPSQEERKYASSRGLSRASLLPRPPTCGLTGGSLEVTRDPGMALLGHKAAGRVVGASLPGPHFCSDGRSVTHLPSQPDSGYYEAEEAGSTAHPSFCAHYRLLTNLTAAVHSTPRLRFAHEVLSLIDSSVHRISRGHNGQHRTGASALPPCRGGPCKQAWPARAPLARFWGRGGTSSLLPVLIKEPFGPCGSVRIWEPWSSDSVACGSHSCFPGGSAEARHCEPGSRARPPPSSCTVSEAGTWLWFCAPGCRCHEGRGCPMLRSGLSFQGLRWVPGLCSPQKAQEERALALRSCVTKDVI